MSSNGNGAEDPMSNETSEELPGSAGPPDEVSPAVSMELQVQQTDPNIRQQSQMILSLVSPDDAQNETTDDDDDFDVNEDDDDNHLLRQEAAKAVVKPVSKAVGNDVIKDTIRQIEESGKPKFGDVGAVAMPGQANQNRSENNPSDEDADDVETGNTSAEVLTARPLSRDELRKEIQSEMMLEAVEATKVVSEEEQPAHRKQWMILLAAVLLVLGIVAAIVASLAGGSSTPATPAPTADTTTEAPTDSPTMAPTATPTLSESQIELLDYLSDVSADGGVALNDTFSPEYEAMLWLSEEFPARYSLGRALEERYAMATLYFATTGEEWINKRDWVNHSANVCDWYSNSPGISCDGGFMRVLDLPLNNMNGGLPGVISLLRDLQRINLAGNKLTGTIPSDIFSTSLAREIVTMTLEGNSLTGTLPTEVGRFTNLQVLDIAQNALNGTLPTEFGNLAGLRTFRSERCKFTGTIPTEVGKLLRLEEWDSRLARFSGPLPVEMGNMESLLRLDFAGLQLITGSIPSSFYGLTSLTNLQLTRIGVAGTISPQIGQLTNLRTLELGLNKFTGSLPTEMGLLTNLFKISWGAVSELTGPLPTELGLLTDLTSINMKGNNHTGPLPTEMANLNLLVTFDMQHNYYLDGTIPTEYGALQALQTFNFAKCSLSGTLPSEMAGLTSLRELQLVESKISGPFPDRWVWELPDLEVMGIGDQIMGTISPDIQFASNLRELYLNGNMLDGPIPTEVGLLTQLQKLILSDNQLSSTIPTEIGLLQRLVEFHIQENGFTGSIPTALSSLSALDTVYLDSNDISGIVPASFCDASKSFADCDEIECTCCTYCCELGECEWTGLGEDLTDEPLRDVYPLVVLPGRRPR